MRFYEQEERRRRRTALFVVLLTASVAGTVLGVYLAFAFVLHWTGFGQGGPSFHWWQPRVFAWTGGGTLGSGSVCL